jgi:pyridoxal kinase
MKTVLLISSQVAASHVGASAATFALQRMGIEVITLPTVLLGRHPGWGDPGRVEVDADGLSRMFLAVQAQGVLDKIDAVITGYFRSSRQITAAAAMIDYVRAAKDDVLVVVDPVMGDEPDGLYVPDAVAEALIRELVPRADIITPNAWELAHIADRPVFDEGSAVEAARTTGCAMVVASSTPSTDLCATLVVEKAQAWCVTTPCYKSVPRGTGDLLTALFTAHILQGKAPRNALENAVSSIDMVLGESQRMNTPELPLIATQDRLVSPRTGVSARPPLQARRHARWVAGVDGCPGGWIAVMLDVTGQYPAIMRPLRGFWDVLLTPERPEIVAVDMPIGFLDKAVRGGRGCERAARERLGDRKSSVFSSPSRRALYTTSYEAACAANEKSAEHAPKLSQQTFALFDKMREIDARITPELQRRVYEAHPEFSFTLMREGAPCTHAKKSPEGEQERVSALQKVGFEAEFLATDTFTPLSAIRDDFLDACACAWSAQRIMFGAAETLPKEPAQDANGLEMAIRG